MHDASPAAQATLTIDLDALAANWRMLADLVAPAACGAAVKADAYGTGLARAVPALARAGCRTFFVAHRAEGVRARAALRGAGLGDGEAHVYVLHGLHPDPGGPADWAADALRPVLGSRPELERWAEAGPTLPACALHVDTGINRLGLTFEDAGRLDAATLGAARVALVMSHFAAADEPGNPVTAAQIDRFAALRRGPSGALPASLANSSGIFLPARPVFDLVRPGYALYGGNPTPHAPNPMRPVAGLSAAILQLRDLRPGDTAGYGALWTARRPTRLAVIGLGYADGLPRNARTVGEAAGGPVALLEGTPCPLVGRVSMDLSLVDVTDAPKGAARPSAALTLLGPTLTVDALGAACGTIGYEILTRLGSRYARRYIGGEG